MISYWQLMAGVACLLMSLTEAQQLEISLDWCVDVNEKVPCVRRPSKQDLCVGERATATTFFKLPVDELHDISPMKISIIRGRMILVKRFNKYTPEGGQWTITYHKSQAENESGLLAVEVVVENTQTEDQFELHIEIEAKNQTTLKTGAMIWFDVFENCRTMPADDNAQLLRDNNNLLQRLLRVTEEKEETCINTRNATEISAFIKENENLIYQVLNDTSEIKRDLDNSSASLIHLMMEMKDFIRKLTADEGIHFIILCILFGLQLFITITVNLWNYWTCRNKSSDDKEHSRIETNSRYSAVPPEDDIQDTSAC